MLTKQNTGDGSERQGTVLCLSFRWAIDPSGYVYEGVTSNRIAGVKATVYYIPFDENDESFWDAPKTENAQLWEASEWDQVNPVYTDADGKYAWDVPEGWWQVKYEKEGYETTYSEWLPVPPPQTSVNIGIISTEAPVVEDVEANDGSVIVTFSQYVDPESIDGIILKDAEGNSVEYTVQYSTDETDLEGKVFVNEIVLSLDSNVFIAEIEVPDTITNYAGTALIPYSEIFREETVFYGDTDRNGRVTIADVLLIRKYLAGIIDENKIDVNAADVDGNGRVTIADVLLVRKYLAGIITSFPAEN